MNFNDCFKNLEKKLLAKLKLDSNLSNENKTEELNKTKIDDKNVNIEQGIEKLFEASENCKNHFYFENLTDDEFFDVSGAKKEFISFYKKIIKSGVGSVIFGGIYLGMKQKYLNNIARISLDENVLDPYKKIISFAHSLKCKTYLKVKSAYGRFNPLYNNEKGLKLASNYGLDPENRQQLLIRISDNRCSEMCNDLARTVMLANIAGFDGIVIDASFENVIGELSSFEFNKRIFGYYSATNDFIKRCLKNIDAKNNTIILKISLLTLFIKEKENANFCKINENLNIERAIDNIKDYISLGVDGFEFIFGTKENEFLNEFNSYEDEFIYKEFIITLRNYFTENNIKNKFGEEIEIFYHDKIENFKDANEFINKKIVNYLDITRKIYSDIKFLDKIKEQKNYLNCINCSYCDKKAQNKRKIECLINPSLTTFENTLISNENKIVAIIGSGISGLICALTLAERGYIVHIFEQRKELNYFGKLTTIFGFDEALLNYYNQIETKINDFVQKKRIVLKLENKFVFDAENDKQYYSIIVATGFKTKFLSISGAILSHVHNIYDVLSNKKIIENKKHIVIYAKSELSLKLALWLSLSNKNITLIIKDANLFKENKNANLFYYFWNLYKNNANILFFSRIIKINEDNLDIIFCKNLNNKSPITLLKIFANDKLNLEKRQINIDCDLLIYEPDIYPNNTLYVDIVNNYYRGEVYLIGNALENSDLNGCIKSGYFVGKNL